MIPLRKAGVVGLLALNASMLNLSHFEIHQRSQSAAGFEANLLYGEGVSRGSREMQSSHDCGACPCARTAGRLEAVPHGIGVKTY